MKVLEIRSPNQLTTVSERQFKLNLVLELFPKVGSRMWAISNQLVCRRPQ
jgi:hypothetical protein